MGCVAPGKKKNSLNYSDWTVFIPEIERIHCAVRSQATVHVCKISGEQICTGMGFSPSTSIKVDAKTIESTRKTEEKLDGRNKEGHERKKPK